MVGLCHRTLIQNTQASPSLNTFLWPLSVAVFPFSAYGVIHPDVTDMNSKEESGRSYFGNQSIRMVSFPFCSIVDNDAWMSSLLDVSPLLTVIS